MPVNLEKYIKYVHISLHYSKRTQSGEASSCEVSETPACILFKKPVERILIRYDQQPSDFMNLLEPAFDSLNNANGQKLTRRIVNIFGSVIHERPSSGTFLTLSRYVRCVWSKIRKKVSFGEIWSKIDNGGWLRRAGQKI